ncbi:MAG: GAF domain-containing sensor histidine kinase [Cyanobacteria bacterium CRU_2_1]|nr:GAF domain-containing sensor histidine kinase [Cyanobacteria bacterium RU_5_0]NJR57569.1 GAF domain-containing sensor histidine kinase [Cyanobacteria bacterium CRU_2_1]
MTKKIVDGSLSTARVQLETVLPSAASPFTDALEVVLSALTEWQASVEDLNQENQSLAIHHRAVVEECQRYRAIGQITQQLRQSLNPAEILDSTVTAIQKLLTADRVVLYRLDAGLATIAAEAVQPGYASMLGTTVDSTVIEKLVSCCYEACLAIDDIQQAALPPAIATLLQHQQVNAILTAPIFKGEDLLGAICVHQCMEVRDWQPSEVEALQQLGAEVAIALRQSDIYQYSQQLNTQVQQHAAQLQKALAFESMLKRITDKVRDSLDENQILQAAVKELTLVLGLGGCNAALYDLNQGTSTIRYEYTHSIPTYQGKVAQMDDFPEIYHQLQQGHYFQFCSLVPNPERGRVAMLACPMFVDLGSSQVIDQTVLGDLWLIHQHEHVFSEFEIRLVQQVANQCAIAIRQARLYQAAQVQVQELEKLNRLKDEFLSTVSHELRTPITNVKMAIQMLKVANTDKKRRQYIEILERESSREAELIDDLLDLQRLEAASYPVALDSIDLQDWLPHLVEPFQSRAADRQQILQATYPANLPPLTSNGTILRRILAELLNNACKYTISGGKINLDVHVEPQPTTDATLVTTFIIRNQAHIPSDELPKIFDKFYRCPNADPWSRGGTGLGLALVQKLVEQLHGSITVESAEGWTTFIVQLARKRDER